MTFGKDLTLATPQHRLWRVRENQDWFRAWFELGDGSEPAVRYEAWRVEAVGREAAVLVKRHTCGRNVPDDERAVSRYFLPVGDPPEAHGFHGTVWGAYDPVIRELGTLVSKLEVLHKHAKHVRRVQHEVSRKRKSEHGQRIKREP